MTELVSSSSCDMIFFLVPHKADHCNADKQEQNKKER